MIKLFSLIFILLLFIACSDDVSYNELDNKKTNTSTTPSTENTLPPKFTSPSNISIDENQLDILQIKTDSTIPLNYTLHGNDSKYLDITSDGNLSFISPPDYESQNLYIITIRASDNNRRAIQVLTINIQNLNDNKPTISAPDNLSINENSLYVYTPSIADKDGDKVITTLNGNDSTFFKINSQTNEIRFKTVPDYETGKHLYTLVLLSSDGIHSSQKIILVNLINVADTPAVLQGKVVSLPENVPTGHYVTKITSVPSSDGDITSYTLIGTGSENFTINTFGEMHTTKVIDYESQATYTLQVYATNVAGNSLPVTLTVNIEDLTEQEIPLLVVIMNWTNYRETSAQVWHDKFFDVSSTSLAQWYLGNTQGEIVIQPATENAGTANDGVIMVEMGISHPGDSSPTSFRNTHIKNAITSSAVDSHMNFSDYDTNGDGSISRKELQIIFIVSGGEASYGDSQSHSIWALAWSFESFNAVTVDGVKIMTYQGDPQKDGSFARFGANHATHKATIGVIAHELGHAMLSLRDYYDNGGGSGLGIYDLMSGGSWASKHSDDYDGMSPTQLTAFNKIDAGLDTNISAISSTQTLTIKCSSKDIIKLNTTKVHEYFLVECRDTLIASSDESFPNARVNYSHKQNHNFTNKLFTTIYHVEDSQSGGDFVHSNTEDGTQTNSHHYLVSLLEKDTSDLMTSTERIEADYIDVHTLGDTITTNRTKLYDGTATNYTIEVLAEDTVQRTMTIKITK